MPRCIAVTKKKIQCSYQAKNGSYCGLHVAKNKEIPVKKVRPIFTVDNTVENKITDNCNICFTDMNVKITRTLTCSHRFCATCINQWFDSCAVVLKDKTCPVCRSIESKYQEKRGTMIHSWRAMILVETS